MAGATAIQSSVPEEEESPEEHIDAEGETEHAAVETAPAMSEIETRARGMGWHPLSEYNGPPGKWQDAKSFVERGEHILPIVRQQNRVLEDRLLKQGRVIEEMGTTMEDMREMMRRSNDQGYQRALREIEERRTAAVAAGDTEAFAAADGQLGALKESHAAETTRKAPPKMDGAPPEVLAFADANAWFNTDGFLTRQMVAEHEKIIAKHPAMNLGDQLDMALDKLKAEFPEKFGGASVRREAVQPVRPKAAGVSAPTNGALRPRTEKSGFDSIPDPDERQQAKAAFSRMKKQMPDFTEAEYLAVYNDPHADVIELNRAAKGRKS